jgi:hypothetical protein
MTTATKCAKPKGAYCRLHNPEPRGYASASEALNKAEQDFNKANPIKSSVPGASFHKNGETRTLHKSIPENIADHIALNQEQLSHLSDMQKKALNGYTGFAAGVCNSVLLAKEFAYEYYEDAPLWKEAPGGACDFVSREDLVDYMETMDGVLASRQEQSRVLYRGIPIYSELHDEIGDSIGKKLPFADAAGLAEGLSEYYKPGTVIKHDHYLSTTASAYYAADRTDNSIGTKKSYYDSNDVPVGIVFELKTNAGLDVTAAARHHSYEREVVLPRETYFKVVNVDVNPQAYDTVSGFDMLNHPEEREQKTFTRLAAVVQMVEVDKNGNEITGTAPHHPERKISNIIPE